MLAIQQRTVLLRAIIVGLGTSGLGLVLAVFGLGVAGFAVAAVGTSPAVRWILGLELGPRPAASATGLQHEPRSEKAPEPPVRQKEATAEESRPRTATSDRVSTDEPGSNQPHRLRLTIGDTAPDFEAETTEGRISFHEWLGDSWGVLFSHARDFTPVCSTELGYMASIKDEFDKRNTKLIGLSVDPVDNHEKRADDIEAIQGTAPNYPVIGDDDFNVSKLYGMLPSDVSGDATSRTPADNQTVRNVFVIGPDKKIKLVLVYPMTTGRNFDEVLRVIDSLQLTANHKVGTRAQWTQGHNVTVAGSVSDAAPKEIWPARWEAGTYKCTSCGYELHVADTEHLPPCPSCGHGEFERVHAGVRNDPRQRPH